MAKLGLVRNARCLRPPVTRKHKKKHRSSSTNKTHRATGDTETRCRRRRFCILAQTGGLADWRTLVVRMCPRIRIQCECACKGTEQRTKKEPSTNAIGSCDCVSLKPTAHPRTHRKQERGSALGVWVCVRLHVWACKHANSLDSRATPAPILYRVCHMHTHRSRTLRSKRWFLSYAHRRRLATQFTVMRHAVCRWHTEIDAHTRACTSQRHRIFVA